MADDQDRLSRLEKEVASQARFTRTLMVVCTCAILGLNFYTTTETFSTMPTLLLTTFMGNLQSICYQWNAIQSTTAKNKAAAGKESK